MKGHCWWWGSLVRSYLTASRTKHSRRFWGFLLSTLPAMLSTTPRHYLVFNGVYVCCCPTSSVILFSFSKLVFRKINPFIFAWNTRQIPPPPLFAPNMCYQFQYLTCRFHVSCIFIRGNYRKCHQLHLLGSFSRRLEQYLEPWKRKKCFRQSQTCYRMNGFLAFFHHELTEAEEFIIYWCCSWRWWLQDPYSWSIRPKPKIQSKPNKLT